MTERLVELDSRIESLKSRLASDPEDTGLQAKIDELSAEYDAISLSLGGDRAPVSGESPAPVGSVEGVVPGAPPGCQPATATFQNITPVVIPTTAPPNVVTSTLTVVGTGAYLYDLNLTTNITHTFCSDLDITLTSPTGTIMTLTTDNGSTFDNVYNGTVWDDDADPDGQVPYTTNSGMVTDHPYVNNTLASPLTPEEPFGSFIGENPNGLWTLTISDDANLDGGSLASWTLEITTLPGAPSTGMFLRSNATPVPIPSGPAVVVSQIAVAGLPGTILDVETMASITHTFPGDLDITLLSPSGTIVTVTTDNASSADNVFNGTLFDVDADPNGLVPYTTNPGMVTDHPYVINTLATPLTPEESFGAFVGENPNGTWTLTISDDASGDAGNLASWSLNFTMASCSCSFACPANVTQVNDTNQCGAVVNYPPPTTLGACNTIVCTPASGSFFPVGTTTVTCVEEIIINSPEGNGCSFTVTVSDTQAPTLTCPANVTQGTDAGQCSAVVTYPAPTNVMDNCPGVGVPTCVPASGSTFAVGTTTVTCTVLDEAGNTGMCSFTVTVNDTTPPTITCPANVTQANDVNQCGAVVNFTTPTPMDNCMGATTVCSPATGSFFPVGTTTVTCTTTDAAGNTASCPFTVTVNDTQPPVITCPANITTTGTGTDGMCNLTAVVTFPPPTVSDNCPGVGVPVCVPASGSTFPEGTTTVTCTVADMAGNTAACSFTVTVNTAGLFGACAIDDFSGDQWSIVTNTTSPLFRFWRYRVAATGELFCGTAELYSYHPLRSLVASDTNDPRFFMNANLNYGANAGTVKVVDQATGRQFVLRDRNLANSVCQ